MPLAVRSISSINQRSALITRVTLPGTKLFFRHPTLAQRYTALNSIWKFECFNEEIHQVSFTATSMLPSVGQFSVKNM